VKLESRLDTVSTTCGSGWVRSQGVRRRQLLRTHPLPQVVLTVSKLEAIF